MKILLFDIETAPNLGYCWGTYEQNVIKVIEPKYMLCFAYKWLGQKKIEAFGLNTMSRTQLAKKLHSLFDEADIVIGHNGDRFDIKNSNTFFILAGLTPPSPYKTVDTLKIARSKFKFNSNRLDDIGEYLGLGRKLKHEGFGLWEKCMSGDKKAWKRMIRYNKQDVALLESVYKALRAWSNTVPDVRVINKPDCPLCGSQSVQARGWQMGHTFKKRRLQCQSCGRWFTGERVKNPKV